VKLKAPSERETLLPYSWGTVAGEQKCTRIGLEGKLKLPSTISIKHQIRKLMLEDLINELEVLRRAEKHAGPVALMPSAGIEIPLMQVEGRPQLLPAVTL